MFGVPRSPSYLGISYSRTRWSRKVFHVSSADEPVVLVEVLAPMGQDDVRRTGLLQGLEAVLDRRAEIGEVAVPEVVDLDLGLATPADERRARRPSPRRPGPPSSAEDDPADRATRPSAISRRMVPPQPISMSSAWAPTASRRSSPDRAGRRSADAWPAAPAAAAHRARSCVIRPTGPPRGAQTAHGGRPASYSASRCCISLRVSIGAQNPS